MKSNSSTLLTGSHEIISDSFFFSYHTLDTSCPKCSYFFVMFSSPLPPRLHIGFHSRTILTKKNPFSCLYLIYPVGPTLNSQGISPHLQSLYPSPLTALIKHIAQYRTFWCLDQIMSGQHTLSCGHYLSWDQASYQHTYHRRKKKERKQEKLTRGNYSLIFRDFSLSNTVYCIKNGFFFPKHQDKLNSISSFYEVVLKEEIKFLFTLDLPLLVNLLLKQKILCSFSVHFNL